MSGRLIPKIVTGITESLPLSSRLNRQKKSLPSPFISTTPTVERMVGLFGLFLPLMAVNFLTNGFGMGDVKLCAAFGWVLGAFTGYCSLAVALTAAVVVGKITNNKLLPLAPFLSGAGMAAIIFREVLISC